MTRFWSIESPLMNGFGTVADIVLLNIVYLICCIPLVTIGAATTALYSVTVKMAKKESPPIAKSFFKSFKANFRISTICWLILLFIGGLLFLDFHFIGAVDGAMKNVFQIILGSILVLLVMVTTYLFPYIAYFENSLKNTFKNVCLLCVIHFPYTVILAGLNVGILIIAMFSPRAFTIVVLAGVFFGFALFSFIKSKLLAKIFAKYEMEA